MMNLNFTKFRELNKKNLAAGLIWILFAGILFGIGPLGMLGNESVSRSVADDNRRTDGVTEELPVIVEFTAQHGYLDSISFVMNRGGGEVSDGTVLFKFFDGAVNLLSETEIPMEEVADGGWTEVPLHRKVKAGETYFYRIEVTGLQGAGPRIEYRSLSGCGPIEVRTFYYGSTVMEDSAPVSSIAYRTPLEPEQFLTYAAFLVFLALLLTAGVRKLPDSGGNRELSAKEALLKWGASLAAVFVTVFFWDFLIVENHFNTVRLDHIVYGTGLAVFLALLWYGIWKLDPQRAGRLFFVWDREKAAAAVRILMFAFLCILSMYYYNSGSNYGHRIASRGSMICFGIAVLTFYPLRRICHRWSILYTALLGAGGIVYGLAERMNGKELFQYVLSVLAALIWGIVVIRLLWNWKEKKLPKLSPGYAAALFVFFALLVVFRNTRTWPFEVAFYFTVLYLQDFTEKEWKLLLRDFCCGLLVSFAAILFFSLLFRPYHRYNYSRYPLFFYSVATCALYLTAVFCAALARLLVKYREKPYWRNNIGGLFVMSVVFCYTFMTISRTAFVALIAAAVCTAAVLCTSWFREHKGKGLSFLAMVPLCGFLVLPMVFTATRSIPAVVGMPYIMDPELAHESILPTDTMDSRRYMNAERFLELTFEKLGDTVRFLDLFQEEGVSDNSLQSVDAASILDVAAAKDFVGLGGINDKAETASNGRADIFRAYWQALNLTGHDTMLVETEQETYYHAHNTYLQSAYDHGIFVGIYLILLGIGSLARSIYYFRKRGAQNEYLVFAVLIIVAFGAASLTEWTFHPSIPLAFALLLVQGPLLRRCSGQIEKV